MRSLALALFVILAAGCAALEPNPHRMTADDVIALSKSGAPAKEIIDQLFRTKSVIPVTAAEIVRPHEAGVSSEVLDFMQYAQLQEIRWRDQFYYWNGPGFYRGFGPCPFPPPRFHRGGSWGC